LVKHFGLFDVEGYKKRLQLLRMMYGETQREFASRLGIPFKRWNEYERGYPLPRDTAFLIRLKIARGVTDWIWFGDEERLAATFVERLRLVEREQHRLGQAKVERLRDRRKRADKAARKVSKTDKVRKAHKGNNSVGSS
jgi:transcriptional regulator with XRE-family HTH domain